LATFWSSGKYNRETEIWEWHTTQGVVPFTDFTYWGSDYPSYDEMPSCMVFGASQGGWKDMGCNDNIYTLMCEE
jgi:hypothetical protein